MTETKPIPQTVDEWLAECGISFTAVLIGSDCPPFCEDAAKKVAMGDVNKYPRRTHIHGKHYRCTFSRIRKGTENYNIPDVLNALSIDFWNSYADEELLALGCKAYRNGETMIKFNFKNPKPTVKASDVLPCIERYMPEDFESWCSDFGYDTDSRKAYGIYELVQKQAKETRAFFTAAELEFPIWETL